MKVQILDAEALRAISPAAISAYARAEGWMWQEAYGAQSDIYAAPGKPELVIPRTKDIGDYASVVAQLLKIYARQANRDELTLYRDLTGAENDVIRVRALGAEADGSISIDAGVELVSRSRDMLLAAACSVTAPRPDYRAGANKEAAEYMRRVRLGQTERGSFVVTLYAPTPPQLLNTQASLLPAPDEPYERLVTQQLMTALRASKTMVEAANFTGSNDLLKRFVPQGVSANLCEAVAGLIDQSGELDISLTWALTRPTAQPRGRVTFSKSEATVLREVARLNRETEPMLDQVIIGYVHKLRRAPDEESGAVTLSAYVDNYMRSIFTQLDPENYDLAVKAHGERKPIIAKGTLVRIGQRWSLSDAEISNFPEPIEILEGRN